MAISSLRPTYAPHARVAMRLLASVRSQASAKPGDIPTLSHSRAAGGQEESPLNDSAEPLQHRAGDPSGDQSGAEHDRGTNHSQAGPKDLPVLNADPGIPDPDIPEPDIPEPDIPESEPPAGLVTMVQLGPEERLRAAEEAYGYSRHVLDQGSQTRPGDSYDTAS